MERLQSPSNYPPSVGKFRHEQVAHRATWAAVPDRASTMAALHIIHVAPQGSSTVTNLNPLDPGTVSSADDTNDTYLGWLQRPGAPGTVHPARFPR
jgi:hypothetical protein